MKKIFFFAICLFTSFLLLSQQQYPEINPCGGTSVVSISISDNDSDGMDDGLEQILLNKFMPVFIRFNDDGCPGPSPTGATGNDTNLVVCRIFPIPPQYTEGSGVQLISLNPTEVVSEKNLKTGLVWYEPTIIAHCALLYGKDCGLTAHTADVEGFTFTLRYIGNIPGGWRYDTTLSNWTGMFIQTVSHAGTLCEKIETLPRLSPDFPNGSDSILASPDKHGNYLTVAKCNSGFLCDPACNGTKIEKTVKIINAGEENAPFVNDLGSFYYEYAGENPWGTANFLDGMGGSAGAIKDKLLKDLSDDFIQGKPLDSCFRICQLYDACFYCGSIAYDECVFSCDTVTPDINGDLTPFYDCTVYADDGPAGKKNVWVYPSPASGSLNISGLSGGFSEISLSGLDGRNILRTHSYMKDIILDIQKIPAGIFLLKVQNDRELFFQKIIVLK